MEKVIIIGNPIPDEIFLREVLRELQPSAEVVIVCEPKACPSPALSAEYIESMDKEFFIESKRKKSKEWKKSCFWE